MAKNAIDSLNNVALPVFLNPIAAMMPMDNPTKNPIKLRMLSMGMSNAYGLHVNYFNMMGQVYGVVDGTRTCYWYLVPVPRT